MDYFNYTLINLIYYTVLFIDMTTPISRKISGKRFRVPNTFITVSVYILQKFFDLT